VVPGVIGGPEELGKRGFARLVRRLMRMSAAPTRLPGARSFDALEGRSSGSKVYAREAARVFAGRRKERPISNRPPLPQRQWATSACPPDRGRSAVAPPANSTREPTGSGKSMRTSTCCSFAKTTSGEKNLGLPEWLEQERRIRAPVDAED